ncbi:MAG: asparagine synthase [Phycisphaeraceae bacterium]|nr:asparagine synthase [Phycisphaeraceae bacterium]
MVRPLGVPLGTPNELAINALAAAVGAAGIKVAIGGEGADEILGGYEPILRLVAQIAAADPGPEVAAATLLESASWIAPGAKATVLAERWVDSIGHDAALIGELGAAIESGGSAAEPRSYLHWLQTVNLPGLLGRLNAACMLASVEARPPFADRRFAEAVARVDTADLFGPEADGTFRTKTVLRRGFAGQVPAEIVARPKASFPTPFAPWAAAMLADPLVSEAIRPLVRPEVSSVLNGDPAAHPLQAWPLANLGLWAVETGIDLDPS